MSSQQKATRKLTTAVISAAMLASTISMSLPALKVDAKTTVTQPTKTVKQTDTSKLGQIKSEKAIIYKSPNATKGTKAGIQKLKLTYYINKTAVYNKTTYYQVSNYKSTTQPSIGWVKAQDLTTKTHMITKNSTTPRYITGTGKGYTRPWGGERNVLFTSLNTDKGTQFKTKTTEKVGDETWYSGTQNKQTIWLKSDQLTTKKPTSVVKPVLKSVNRLGRINTQIAKVYPDINNLKKSAQATEKNLGKTYYITQQATIGKDIYFQLSTHPTSSTAKIGWIKSSDVKSVTQSTAQKPTTQQVLTGTGEGYGIPWGGKNDIVEKSLEKDGKFTINKAIKAGDEIWYQGTTTNNKNIWVSSAQVKNYKEPSKPKPEEPTDPSKPTDPTKPTDPSKPDTPQQPEATAITKVGTLKDTTTKIYQDLTDLTKTIDGSNYTNENFYVYKQATVDNKTYYEISRTDGTKTKAVGWVEKGQITLTDITSSTTTNLKLYLTGFGKAYNISSGTTNNVVYSSLDKYRANAFTAKKTEVINNKTYYQGSIGGKTVWITPEQVGNNYLAENLRKTSDITQDEMQDYLIEKKGNGIKTNNLYKMIPAFLKVQEKYGINAQFMFAHAIWETGWGGSLISQYKNNFFGYQAYDSAPFTCALYFPSGQAGLEYYADAIYNKYLKAGAIYNNGVNIAGMNTKYATDQNWGRNISRLMEDMKPYDSKYYAAQPISTLDPAPIKTIYDHIIPAGKPQPDTFFTFDEGITATATLLTPVYSMPYATTARQIGTLSLGQQVAILGHNKDIWDYEDSKGNLKGRWFRVSYNGNDQAWIRSDYLNIQNLAVTNVDGSNVRDKATSKDSNIVATLNKDKYLKLVTDSKGTVVIAKDENNKTWYQIYIPDTTTKAWISASIVTKF
ncbi:glucosaminidase domain-containing protein [Rummeliibacillus sp. NPDC094406]|uniref:glucosaminidase domain-containing protein n=1 Tax=Rummeliibacillus sp. NPDC094406 TaxID=3364511 RepID=UPI0037F62F8F